MSFNFSKKYLSAKGGSKKKISNFLDCFLFKKFIICSFTIVALSFIDSVSMKTNSKFTFDNFVVGESNRMPYAASKRICEKHTLAYNPLFIHGDVGMGKTPLLNAMVIDLKANFPVL